MAKTTATSEYTDIDLLFKPHPITGDVTIKKDDAAVKRAVKNILLSNFYERPFKPGFGSGLNNALFELDTDRKIRRLGSIVQESIEKLEPRVTNVQIKMFVRENTIDMTVHFDIVHGSRNQETKITVNRIR